MNNIIIVIVLYKIGLNESKAFASLRSVLCNSFILFQEIKIKILIYDNSPDEFINKLKKEKSDENLYYYHDKSNGGICAAYNLAFQVSLTEDFKWILLLDQDTELPDNYLHNSFKIIDKIKKQDKIAAIIPNVVMDSKIISPQKRVIGLIGYGVVPRGINSKKILAINSGALISTDFLRITNGFDTMFKLDGLDHWLFATIYMKRWNIYIRGDKIKHNLSVGNSEFVPQERYYSILSSEWEFISQFDTYFARIVYLFHLIYRGIKQYKLLDNKKIIGMTFGHAFFVIKKVLNFKK